MNETQTFWIWICWQPVANSLATNNFCRLASHRVVVVKSIWQIPGLHAQLPPRYCQYICMYIMKLATVACVQRPRLRPRPLPQRQTFLNEANNLQTKDEKWVFEILRLGVTFRLEENDIRSKFLDKYLRYISFTFSAIIKCSFYSHTKA